MAEPTPEEVISSASLKLLTIRAALPESGPLDARSLRRVRDDLRQLQLQLDHPQFQPSLF